MSRKIVEVLIRLVFLMIALFCTLKTGGGKIVEVLIRLVFLLIILFCTQKTAQTRDVFKNADFKRGRKIIKVNRLKIK